MHSVNRVRRRLPELLTIVVMMILLFHRWIVEVVIAVMMLFLLLLDIGLRFTPGRHTLAHIVDWGLLFGLIALWVYINRTALAVWEQDATAEHSLHRDRI